MRRFRGLASSRQVSPLAAVDAKQPDIAIHMADLPRRVEPRSEPVRVEYKSRPVRSALKSKLAKVTFKAVYDPKTGKTQLVDIFVGTEWRGSRSTRRQAMAYAIARSYHLEAQAGIEPA